MAPGRLRDPNDMFRLAEGIERARAARAESAPTPDPASATADAAEVAAEPTPATMPPAEPGRAGLASTEPGPADVPDGDPLDGLTVLIPRDPERAAPLAALLTERGASTLVSPAITRGAVEDPGPVDDAVRALSHGAFAWVVVTSLNAITELVAAAERLDVRLAGATTRWAAVGPATARGLEAIGVEVALVPEENSAHGLLAVLPGPDAGLAVPRVLVPQGDLAAPRMAEGLAAAGYDPTVVTVYRTVAHTLAPEVVAAWRAGDVDVVVLTSGSVAREVADQLGAHGCVAGVAIGRPTARVAAEVDLRVDAIAASADDEGLLAAIERVATETRADRLARRATSGRAATTPLVRRTPTSVSSTPLTPRPEDTP